MIQRLDGGLLIQAEQSCVLRRVQVQPDNIGGLTIKIGVVAGHVPLQPVWPQPGCAPDAVHGIFTDSQMLGQFATGPMRGAIGRFASRGRQHFRLQFGSDYTRLLAGVPFAYQSGDPMAHKALLPLRNSRSGRAEPLLNIFVTATSSQHQD